MAFQTSTVTIVSDNPLYPNNKVSITVDNDLDPTHTVVVLNTSFPYIVEFLNCPQAVGKRYISDWLYKRLLDKYSSDKGKVYNTLQKEFCPYPYVTIDYDLIQKEIQQEIEQNLIERDKTISLLEYVGASLSLAKDLNPIHLLQWLSLPIVDEFGNPIKSFPLLLNYQNKTDIEINTELIERKLRDFFATKYFISISYPLDNKIETKAEDEYQVYTGNKSDDYFDKSNKFNKLINKSKVKTLDSILQTAGDIKNSVLGIIGLASAASSLKGKLQSLKNLKPSIKIPKAPKLNFNKALVTNKIKKSEQKPKKKKRLSGKKGKPIPQIPDAKNVNVENLKKQAGSLKEKTSEQLKNAETARNQIDSRIEELRKLSNMTPEEIIAYKRAQGFTGTITITQKGSPQ